MLIPSSLTYFTISRTNPGLLTTFPFYILLINALENFFSKFTDKNCDIKTFFQNTVILKRPGVANFADIIKVAIILVKITLKNSIKVKRVTDYTLKYNFYLYYPVWKKLPIPFILVHQLIFSIDCIFSKQTILIHANPASKSFL